MTPVEATQAMYDRTRAGDWDGVAALMADDLVIHEPSTLPYGGEWRGRDAFQRLFASVMAHWDDPMVETISLLGNETHAVALLHFTMTAKSNGVRFSQHVVEVSRFNADGKIADIRIHYFDTGEMARLAGFA
jgi:ketosteroid isomerase-like protein